MSKPIQLLDVGVDWLTVTASDRIKGTRLGLFGVEQMRQAQEKGDKIRPWGMAGYQGWSVGSVQTGDREDSVIVRLGSLLARSSWRFAYSASDSVSRLDCQYTLRSAVKPARVIKQHYKSALAHNNKDRRPGTVSLFTSSDGSSTLYLGKRTSEQFGRIYDKGAESQQKEYDGAVRYEVEFKGKRAQQVSEMLYSTNNELLEVSMRVSSFFTARGVYPPSPTIDIENNPLPPNICFPSDLLPLPGRLTDTQRRLRWLAKSVAPFATELVSDGRGALLLEALNLYIDKETGELKVKLAKPESEEVED